MSSGLFVVWDHIVVVSAVVNIDAFTNIDIVIVNIPIVWKFWQVLKTFVAPHHFYMIFWKCYNWWEGQISSCLFEVWDCIVNANAVVNIDAFTSTDIVIVNITTVKSFDTFWRLLWHTIIFAWFFENATTDKTVKSHPDCLQFKTALSLLVQLWILMLLPILTL